MSHESSNDPAIWKIEVVHYNCLNESLNFIALKFSYKSNLFTSFVKLSSLQCIEQFTEDVFGS